MKKYINAEASIHEMKLIQLGAKVEQINGKLCYVKFKIGGIDIEYVYNLNSKNKYFLERIKPYKLPVKEYNSEADIVDIIEIDIKQFGLASRSKNIRSFIEVNSELGIVMKRFEDLYLYYNVPQTEVDIILTSIKKIQEEITKTQESSQRVFFEKDPDNL